ncbi:cysteine protease [Theileria equi strain WA]|uniref:Cysteine protease n=1 Tax=Theileria equi strain WA TaxID=1537102 RepID=L0AYN2_THEEQ|nr:cysteine protease [Theileria equi strain WA]AFZ80702.1 cysteine protease [Theileria equi strain WA]|eukprot:XP_004830368.1 cysteine protease [Theileria equi strain WA]
MVAVISANPSERLMDNRIDDDVEVAEEQTSFFRRFFAKRRNVIFLSAASFLLLVLASTLTGIFVARHRAVVAFKENLTQFLDEKFVLTEPKERASHVEELTDLFSNGYISADHVSELEALMEFDEFNKFYSREHADADERRVRFLAFRNNYNAVKAQTGEESYEKGINKFSDMTDEEFNLRFPALSVEELKKSLEVSASEEFTSPEHLDKVRIAKGLGVEDSVDGEDLDWRKLNGVTPVKDQGNCGSCWAFAAVGSVESLYLIKKGQALDLSEQELVNCEENSNGCEGGLPNKALEYIKAKGISHSKDLPYHAANEECVVSSSDKVFIHSFFANTGLDILNKSLVVSPTIVAIAASKEFTAYKGGIFTGECAPELNHAVLLVGEGHDEATGKRFWIVKNSWGTDWGENGFFRFERTDEGSDKCDILEFGFTPALKCHSKKL